MNFPVTHAVGQTYTAPNGITYRWNGAAWDIVPEVFASPVPLTPVVSPALAPVISVVPCHTMGPTPPPGPVPGDFWFDTIRGFLFTWYDDGNTKQWIVANPGKGSEIGPAGPVGPGGPPGPGSNIDGTRPEEFGMSPGIPYTGAEWLAVFQQAIERGAPVVLSPGNWITSGKIEYVLPDNAYVGLIGVPGATTFSTALGVTGGQVLYMGRPRHVGSLNVDWTDNDHTHKETLHPSTTLTADALIGNGIVTVADASMIDPGDLIVIRSQRLFQSGENRNTTFCGETCQVLSKSGNALTLRYVLKDSYKVGTLYSGTCIGGSTTTANLTTLGVNEAKVSGMRITVVSGTGAGQQTWITKYVDTTNIASFDAQWGVSLSQDTLEPLAVALDATSVVNIDAQPYVFVIKSPAQFYVSGITFDNILSNEIGITTAFSFYGHANSVIDQIKIINTFRFGAQISDFMNLKFTNSTINDVNQTSNGYGILMASGRVAIVSGNTFNNCRRGLDSGGDTVMYDVLADGNAYIGGHADTDGVPWSDLNNNYGLGSHGQASDWHFTNSLISGIRVPILCRGNAMYCTNTKVWGPVTAHVWAYLGDGLVVDGYEYVAYQSGYAGGANPPATGSGHFLYISGNHYIGTISASNVRLNGLQGSLIYAFDVNLADGRAKVNLQVVGRLNLLPAAGRTIYILDGENSYAGIGWELDVPPIWNIGPGSWAWSHNWATNPTTLGRTAYWRINSIWSARMADDTVVELPYQASTSSLHVAISNNAGGTPVVLDKFYNVATGLLSTLGTETASTFVGVNIPPTGTNTTDGRLAVFADFSRFILGNRMGAIFWAEVRLT